MLHNLYIYHMNTQRDVHLKDFQWYCWYCKPDGSTKRSSLVTLLHLKKSHITLKNNKEYVKTDQEK